jgi:hypothetical protein
VRYAKTQFLESPSLGGLIQFFANEAKFGPISGYNPEIKASIAARLLLARQLNPHSL